MSPLKLGPVFLLCPDIRLITAARSVFDDHSTVRTDAQHPGYDAPTLSHTRLLAHIVQTVSRFI